MKTKILINKELIGKRILGKRKMFTSLFGRYYYDAEEITPIEIAGEYFKTKERYSNWYKIKDFKIIQVLN